MIYPVYRGAIRLSQVLALLFGNRYIALFLLTLGSATPIAQAQSGDSPPITSMHMVTTEDNASQGFTPVVMDIEGAAALEQYTFAIVTSPAHGKASVVTAAQAGQVHLAWDAVDAPNLGGYRIYYVLSPHPVDSGNSCLDELGGADTIDVHAPKTTVTVPDLEPGKT